MTDIFKSAVAGLWRKRVRTLLTMGGIVIGVGLVAVVSIISEAGRQTVDSELENMGLGGLSVTASGTGELEEQALDVLREMDEVSSAVPLMLDTASVTAVDGGSQSLMLCGIDSGEIQAIGLTKQYGRMLSREDIASCARTCVVDEAVAKEVLCRDNAVGMTMVIPVGGVEETFTVVGVTKAGSTLLQNVAQWIPGMVYIPYTTMQQLTGRTTFDQFAVRLEEGLDEETQAGHIEEVLARAGGSGYQASNLSAQKEKLSGVMDIVTLVLTAISAISLLVAGLSIMTVMTVAVSERTREIGIKKALGATKARIMREFLTEALLLSLAGGVLGVAIGGGLGMIGLALFGITVPLPQTLLWLVLFAGGVGAVFGVYPAYKAANLHPVEALRCE